MPVIIRPVDLHREAEVGVDDEVGRHSRIRPSEVARSLVVTRSVPSSRHTARGACGPVSRGHLDDHVDELVVDRRLATGQERPHLAAEVGPVEDLVPVDRAAASCWCCSSVSSSIFLNTILNSTVEVYPFGVTTETLLTIGDLARRSGVAVGTLRMWETRHGFPVATRLPSGHRRYAEATVDQVAEVARRRDAGTRLDMAIAAVVDGSAPRGAVGLREPAPPAPAPAPGAAAQVHAARPHLGAGGRVLRPGPAPVAVRVVPGRALLPPRRAALARARPHRAGRLGARGVLLRARRRRPRRGRPPRRRPDAARVVAGLPRPRLPRASSPPGSCPARRARPTSSASSSRCGPSRRSPPSTPPGAAPRSSPSSVTTPARCCAPRLPRPATSYPRTCGTPPTSSTGCSSTPTGSADRRTEVARRRGYDVRQGGPGVRRASDDGPHGRSRHARACSSSSSSRPSPWSRLRRRLDLRRRGPRRRRG